MTSTSANLEPVVMDEATDWQGHILPRSTTRYLIPGCCVRLVIRNSETEACEAIYFRITKIKDGTFWGTAMDTYRLLNWVGIPLADAEEENDGKGESGKRTMTWRREHINEIPMEKFMQQPKRFLKNVRAVQAKDFGYPITGLRGATC